MKPAHVYHDTKDDRAEAHRLLSLLHPRRRVAFLADCCKRATLPRSRVHPGPHRRTRELAELACRDSSADERLTLDLLFDLFTLSMTHQLDLTAALRRLEQWGRAETRR